MPRLDLSEVASGVLQVGSVRVQAALADIVRGAHRVSMRGLDRLAVTFAHLGVLTRTRIHRQRVQPVR